MDAKYQSIPLDSEKHTPAQSDTSSVTSEDADEYPGDLKSTWRKSTIEERLASRWLWLIHAILLTISFSLFIMSSQPISILRHVRQFSAWSAADAAVNYEPVRYNISTKDSRFTGARSEVDRAWREISYDMGDQWLSKSDFAKLDMPASHLKVDHPKTGEEGYRVGMEVFHQLHCINLLRRVTYKEYYEPLGGEFSHGKEALQAHTDHCLEVLRLNTMCSADIGLFTFYMIKGDPLAWPELNSKHTCRNFDSVRQWAFDHSVGNMEVGTVN